MKKLMERSKTLIFNVQGGIGRNIFATAVIRNLKKAYPEKDIFVVAGFSDVFFNNPHIKRVYNFGKTYYLYDDYIKDKKDIFVVDAEPYKHPDYVAGKKHVVECWCELLGVPCDSVTPEMYFTRNELDVAEAFASKYTKPFVLFQHVGGKTPSQCNKQDQLISKATMYRRSLPEKTAQDVANRLIKDGYAVGSVQTPNQFCPKGVDKICFSIRAIIGLIPKVDGLICIDSFLHHAAAGMGIQALVLWGGTSPDKLGYTMHKNLRHNLCPTPECHRPNSYLFDIKSTGFMWDCPHSDKCMDYTVEEIVDGFKSIKKDTYGTKEKPVKIETKQNCDNQSACKLL